MAVQMLTHIGVCVSDLERSVAFYRDVLGCKEVGRIATGGEPSERLLELPGVQLEAVYLEREGYRIELLYFPSPGAVGPAAPRPMNQLGITHFSLRVDDLDAICAALGRAGGHVLPGTRMDHGNTHVCMAVDPDGTRLELIQAPGDPAALPDPVAPE